MTDKLQREKQHPAAGQRRAKRLRLIAMTTAVILALICALCLLGDHKSADERLAEIEAARAVPDTQNAALIYNELLQDPRATSLSDSHPAILNDGHLFYQRRTEPWRTEDCPELAAWIDECAPILDKLAEASQLDACRFPLGIDLVFDASTIERWSPMRQWAFLLMFAVNNDLAEGRFDAAVTKYRCVIQMANHLRQQPLLVDHIIASGIMELALKSTARFVVTGNPSPGFLQEIEAMPLPLTDDWPHRRKQIRLIEDLTTRKMKEPFTLWERLKYPITSYRFKRTMKKAYPNQQESPTESTAKRYRQNTARARGLHILIALRRHRHETGQWPKGLHDVKASVPETVWTDPLNGDPFIYRRREDGFELYSKGLNGLDDHGRADPNGPDDVPIWMPPPPTEKEMLKQLKEIYGDRYRGLLYDQNDPKQPDTNDV